MDLLPALIPTPPILSRTFFHTAFVFPNSHLFVLLIDCHPLLEKTHGAATEKIEVIVWKV